MKSRLDVFVNDIDIENRRQQQQLLNKNNFKVTKLLQETTRIIFCHKSSNKRIDSLDQKCLNEQKNWKNSDMQDCFLAVLPQNANDEDKENQQQHTAKKKK